ncbi:ABC transporter permease [Brachybacterium alimentarium]|uniref:ABC transporter permease n=1 Tax=Brachybacterium alimentarium TaxID=47845 RepID=A0A2A3YM98_9MICO|nr:ABC-2 family transporter protein [Brachybacterium alimentarium]PCC34847.1 ABC transporter permease [Brachybacterium alimentarium]PCC40225.1 ABC transporter permease [Brachybacterium alimentarium]RCS68991.1 ABC transporter permease [Brachybacterium alimentarium]RCS82889.1 ABC transporter permease [Brachybacterium alimentarium]RCS90234.1 ABC transporter permease [Brachybacterium alimentarium]
MPTYWSIASASFRQYSTYRMATAAGVFTNTVFGFIRASIMFAAIASAGGELNGYTIAQAATYVWLGQALLAPIEAFGTREVSQRVHQGDVAIDLLRPTSFLGLHYAQKLGRSGFLLLGRGIPPLVVGALVTGLALPESPLSYLLGAFSLLLAITVAFLADMMVNLAAFWLLETRGLTIVYNAVMNLLSGFLIPILWFPDWLLTIARATPFPSMIQTPIDTLSGRVPPLEALPLVATQAGWLIVLALMAHLMLRAGVRSVEVQGG